MCRLWESLPIPTTWCHRRRTLLIQILDRIVYRVRVGKKRAVASPTHRLRLCLCLLVRVVMGVGRWNIYGIGISQNVGVSSPNFWQCGGVPLVLWSRRR